jgi:DNA processing protein
MYKEITIKNKQYPKNLKKINDPPETIYYKGNFSKEIFKNCLAVVGTRKITEYGRRVVERVVAEIAGSGITIVSGFMYGVDITSHRTALDVGGKTIAVMPCGIEKIHPSYQKKTYEEILNNNGLIISEWSGVYPPAKWTYPHRNRIVAGLSDATLIIEGSKNSGSLITAKLALNFNRKLFAIPGPITSIVSYITNLLIKEGKAELVSRAEDVIGFYFKKRNKCNGNKKVNNDDTLSKKIIRELRRESKSIDELGRILQIDSKNIGIEISMLELQGHIKEKQGKYYVN